MVANEINVRSEKVAKQFNHSKICCDYKKSGSYLQIHKNVSLKNCVIFNEFVKNSLLDSYGNNLFAAKKLYARNNMNKVDPIETWRTVIAHLLP